MRSLIISLSYLIISCFSHTQILNLEKYRSDGDSLTNYAINFVGSLNMNNRSAAEDSPVNLFGYNFSLSGIYTPNKHGYIFIAHRNFLRINENPFINFGYIHTRVNFFRTNRLNFEVFAQMSDDNFRGLNPRLLSGSAIRYRFVDSDESELALSVGAFYEFERWIHPVSEEKKDVNLIKLSNNIIFRHSFNKNISINGLFYYQTGYDSSISKFRNRYSADLNINSKITEKLSFTTQAEFAYEDRPIVPITPFIFSLRFGVSLDI